MKEKILTKDYIESLGYDVDEINYRIFLVKNFLNEKELDYILNIVTNLSQEEWEYHYLNGVRDMAYLKFGRTDIENLVAEGLYEITNNWKDKSYELKDKEITGYLHSRYQKLFNFRDDLIFNGCSTVQRQYEGVPLVEHVDNHTDNSLVYAVVTYLNNDYSGGQVYFKNQNIYMNPEPGSALIFPTTDEWRHGVTEVGPGPHRYVIPSFVSIKNFWEVHKENNYDLEKTYEYFKL